MLLSIDGLKPEAVLDAEAHGLKLPNLRAMMRDGAYATGVRGVLPTLTYPSHTTILTGASPASHGIYDNTTFDPYNRNHEGWYWYAEDIKVPTLWDAASAAGLVTANVYWPVSVGANIRYNLAEIWRAGTEDDLKLQRVVSTPGLEKELVAQLGRYPGGIEDTVDEDEVRTRFAIRLLESKHPDFMTVYLCGLDTEQHKSGPFSDASNQVLERLDTMIGQLRAAAERAAPSRASLVIVSDHGFAKVDHDVNLYSSFLAAGLFAAEGPEKITSWKAMPWPAGGGAAIMLADPKDDATRTQVAQLLAQLAADDNNGIDRVLTADEIAAERGFPGAAFFVSFKLGYELGLGFQPPLVSAPTHLGMHGYVPDLPAMRASFFMVGPGVAHGKSLGDIDMRAIAPTVASILKVKLAAAELPPLAVK
ncbi:ectonucleotide pyrophosphatase/phosphodiesterase [Telmatospirillum sp.]|uniref:alkaline phosphatase family protein n=1 Tax=Telmatospirillum sp. TaxID=2079197 RepID=UPI002842A702|nr:ectonucleotide pyrophosphatase/phosphodiesterase [Telmatospirillum sp.]MDR3438336.1 ectonucleotide pyrophosphatase/phosphodiesterase [Telmatospirillum sp.]